MAAIACAVVLAAGGCGSSESASGPPTVRWYVFNEPSGAFDTAAETCTREAGGRYKVELVDLPTDADQQRELVVRRLAAEDPDIDVIGMDVNWTAEFAEAGWIQPWTGADERAGTEGAIPALLETSRYRDRQWAAPFTTNTQLLWYRKDRVKTPPKTWDEMIDMAGRLGENGTIQVQGAQYEGLVVWFNSLVASAGGKIVDDAGQPVLGPPARRAAEVMQRMASSPSASPSLSNAKEDESRLGFQEGTSSFMVNYSFVYPSAKEDAPEVAKQMGWARWPSVVPGQPSRVTLGGINLGVSRYSREPEAAFDAALCLRQPKNQLVVAEEGGLPPTNAALYETPEIEKAFPFADVLEATLRDGVARPVSPAYSDISLAVQKTVHPPAELDPATAVVELREKLAEVRTGGLF
jgi:multiple sugar transport system substrate-binding protein